MSLTTVKYWYVGNWYPDDADWLQEQDIRHETKTNTLPFSAGKRTVYRHGHHTGHSGLHLTTKNEQQELLIKLRFEPNLILMSVVVGEDNEIRLL